MSYVTRFFALLSSIFTIKMAAATAVGQITDGVVPVEVPDFAPADRGTPAAQLMRSLGGLKVNGRPVDPAFRAQCAQEAIAKAQARRKRKALRYAQQQLATERHASLKLASLAS